MRADRFAVVFLVSTAAMSLAPAPADAFCRTRTVPVPANFDPAGGCFGEGQSLYHLSVCVTYQLGAELNVLPTDTLSAAMAEAFGRWTANNPVCLPGISAIELAPTNDSVIAQYVVGGPNRNMIGFVPGPWPHAGAADTLALTTLTFNATTGEIFDADIELSSDPSSNFSFGGSSTMDGVTFVDVLTHEAGHFLGLAHSSAAGALMQPVLTPGETPTRAIGSDDQAGICNIYPTRYNRNRATDGVRATACELSAGTAAASTCGDPAITHGCSTSPGQTTSASWLIVIAAAAVLLLRGRRPVPAKT